MMDSLEDVWSRVIDKLNTKLSDISVTTWFSGTSPVDFDENNFVILAPNEFKLKMISQHYADTVKECLHEIFAFDIDLIVLLPDEEVEYFANKKAQGSLTEMNAYTFENFIVGASNKFAHAAARGVAENPGKIYNPLFIYGNSGLGKTHLLLAIGHYLIDETPNIKIAYVKGDEFTNQLVEAIKVGTTDEFRQKYRGVDLLLVDDIQFIAGKVQTQEEFFHTFNSLYESGKQIVITSDRPPLEMTKLEDRLRTRFEGGLMADVQPPDLETRMAITRDKAEKLGMNLSPEVVTYVAETITSNIRQLEGVIKRMTAYREILDDSISVASVKRAIKDVIRIGAYIPTPEVIIEETALYYCLTQEDLRGQRRSKNTALARQVSMHLMRILTNMSLSDIGAEYEGRSHATVLSSINKVETLIKDKPEVAAAVRDITANINAHSR